MNLHIELMLLFDFLPIMVSQLLLCFYSRPFLRESIWHILIIHSLLDEGTLNGDTRVSATHQSYYIVPQCPSLQNGEFQWKSRESPMNLCNLQVFRGLRSVCSSRLKCYFCHRNLHILLFLLQNFYLWLKWKHIFHCNQSCESREGHTVVSHPEGNVELEIQGLGTSLLTANPLQPPPRRLWIISIYL